MSTTIRGHVYPSTFSPAQKIPAVLHDDLLALAPVQVVVLIQQAQLASDVRRYVLEEVVARIRSERSRVDSPIAFAKKLIASAITGAFALSAGQHLESDILRRVDEARKAAERRAEAKIRAAAAAAPADTAKRDEAFRQLAKLGFHILEPQAEAPSPQAWPAAESREA